MKNGKKLFYLFAVVVISLGFLGGCTKAWKVDQGDPAKSFWRDQVQYPYPVKYAKGTDALGVEWEIGYMDIYNGSAPDPKVLVLIHGKGAFGGYFGHVIKAAADSGLRVIVPDIPHYGKSIPGNIDKPLTRTLQDTREAIHDVLVNKLGIKKATYLGHSLGGQWVLGYALQYPDVVEKIILEAPGGLEEYPAIVKIPISKDKVLNIPFFAKSYVRDFDTWKKVHGKTLADEYKKTKEDIQLWYYFKAKDPKTGEIKSIPMGYFLKETPYADFVTQVRVNMIDGNKKEYDNYIITYVRDIYTLGIEIGKDDPMSITKRVKEIKVPICLLFGDKEPFIPVKFLSGLGNLKKEVIKPFYNNLKAAGNTPVVKVYPGVGHFVHTDVPDEFAKDVVDFTLKGSITAPSDVDGF